MYRWSSSREAAYRDHYAVKNSCNKITFEYAGFDTSFDFAANERRLRSGLLNQRVIIFHPPVSAT